MTYSKWPRRLFQKCHISSLFRRVYDRPNETH
jgi:hypothetical protein